MRHTKDILSNVLCKSALRLKGLFCYSHNLCPSVFRMHKDILIPSISLIPLAWAQGCMPNRRTERVLITTGRTFPSDNFVYRGKPVCLMVRGNTIFWEDVMESIQLLLCGNAWQKKPRDWLRKIHPPFHTSVLGVIRYHYISPDLKFISRLYIFMYFRKGRKENVLVCKSVSSV